MREFHDWAWISVSPTWRVGFSFGDHTAFGWVHKAPNFWAIRVPLTNYYLSAYRRGK